MHKLQRIDAAMEINRQETLGWALHREADRGFADFNRSFSFDRRLFEADVRASIAHCEGLLSAGVLTARGRTDQIALCNRISKPENETELFR